MISSVPMKVGKKTHKLKVSIKAQMRLEKEHGKPMGDLLEVLISGAGGVCMVVSAMAAFLDDGKGVDEDAAADVVEALGGSGAVTQYMAEALQVAFPFLKPGEGGEDGDASAEEPEAGNAENPDPA